jgi:DNA-binding response OmpR family regulator
VKVLLVEDEADLAADIQTYLSHADYTCELASTLDQATQKIVNYQYDCVLLDLTLPGGDGMTLLQWLKQQQRPEGIIIISAKNNIDDKVKGLELGADDYLAKPFHLSELAARIHAVTRRKHAVHSNILIQDELHIDLLAKSVSVSDVLLPLTKKEFDLLLLLVGNKHKVISKSAIAEHLSGELADMMDSHDFVYAHIKNLKRKLTEAGCGQYLKTHYATGYKWEI